LAKKNWSKNAKKICNFGSIGEFCVDESVSWGKELGSIPNKGEREKGSKKPSLDKTFPSRCKKWAQARNKAKGTVSREGRGLDWKSLEENHESSGGGTIRKIQMWAGGEERGYQKPSGGYSVQ